MSLATTLSAVAPNVTNTMLGELVQALNANAIGSLIRPLLDGVIATPDEALKSDTVPESDVARAALTQTIYSSFDNHRRRRVASLGRITGLTAEAVLTLIEDNNDFRVSQGRTSGETYVSVRSLS